MAPLLTFSQNKQNTKVNKPEINKFYIPKVKVVDFRKLVTELLPLITSDAIVLFNGIDISQWKNSKNADSNADSKWIIENGVVAVDKKREILAIEFKGYINIPEEVNYKMSQIFGVIVRDLCQGKTPERKCIYIIYTNLQFKQFI